MTRTEIEKIVRSPKNRAAILQKPGQRYNCWLYRREDGSICDLKKLGIESYWEGSGVEPIIVGCIFTSSDIPGLIDEIIEALAVEKE